MSFFAPCAIGILPAYLSYYLNVEESGHKRAIYYGNIAGLGLISFYFLLGILTIIFGKVIGMSLMTFNREISATILFVVGICLLLNINVNIKKIMPFRNQSLSTSSLNRTHYEKGIFLFGVFYGIEAFMCAFLLMVPLMIYPLLGGDLLTSILSFIFFSLALGLCMTVATVLISKSRKIITERFMATTATLKTIAGIVMLLTAVYLVYTVIALPSMTMSDMNMGKMNQKKHHQQTNMEEKK